MRFTSKAVKACQLFFIVTLLLAFSTRTQAQSQPATTRLASTLQVRPKVFSGNGWSIAAPENWTTFNPAPRPTVLYLIGDGRPGIPVVDGTLSVIKAGLTVQVFPKGALTLKQRMEQELDELKTSPAFQNLNAPVVQEIKLQDGADATLLTAEFIRRQNGRVSLQSKVYRTGADGQSLIATSFVTCSRPGLRSVKAMGLADTMEKTVRSLTTDATKLNLAGLKAAYAAHNWDTADVMERVRAANDLLEEKKYAPAVAGFKKAVARFDVVPAAHNGLAWALLQNDAADRATLTRALDEATKAAEQTERLDPSALDTLAWAYSRNGDRDYAQETIKAALALDPKNPDLLERQKALQK